MLIDVTELRLSRAALRTLRIALGFRSVLRTRRRAESLSRRRPIAELPHGESRHARGCVSVSAEGTGSAAFARFNLQLLALGAPAHLLEAPPLTCSKPAIVH